MRALTCLAALLPLATLHPSSEACGYGIMRVFLVAHHQDAHARWHSFALLGDAEPTGPTTWTTIDSHTYTPLQETVTAETGYPARFTLVGQAGTHAVVDSKRVFISGQRETGGHTMAAVDLGDVHDYAFAVTGPALGLKQTPFALAPGRDADARWLAAQQIEAKGAVDVAHVGAVDILATEGTGGITVVRRDGKVVASVVGSPVGMLASDEMQYLLVEANHEITPVMLWAS